MSSKALPTVARVTRSRTRASSATAATTATAVVEAGSMAPPPAKRRKVSPTNTKKEPIERELTSLGLAPKLEPPPPLAPLDPRDFNLSHAIAHLSTIDARFGPLFRRIPCRPFLRAVEHIDPFRTLVTSIIGQQVSWMAARSITRRFVQLFCGDVDEDSGGEGVKGDGPFPTREQVAKADVAALKGVGCSTRKAEYLIELAQHFTSGRLTDQLLLNGSDKEVADALIAVRGIGRWTVDMFLIFTLRRPDVLPVGDLGVQKGLLRWVLAAHGALPPSVPKSPKSPKTPKTPKKTHMPSDYGSASAAGVPVTPTPAAAPATPATPATPTATPLAASASTATLVDTDSQSQSQPDLDSRYVLVTPTKLSTLSLASTRTAPPADTESKLPPPAPDSILMTPEGWDDQAAHRAAPLPEGLSIAVLKSRLAGKKAKGGVYLLPEEMEALTAAWRPYRSVGVYYTWSMAGEKS